MFWVFFWYFECLLLKKRIMSCKNPLVQFTKVFTEFKSKNFVRKTTVLISQYFVLFELFDVEMVAVGTHTSWENPHVHNTTFLFLYFHENLIYRCLGAPPGQSSIHKFCVVGFTSFIHLLVTLLLLFCHNILPSMFAIHTYSSYLHLST